MRRAACFFCCVGGITGASSMRPGTTPPPALRRGSEVLILKNLYIGAAEYDYHTLLKVAEMAGLAGIVGFHEAGDGYLVSFPDGENTDTLINDYKSRLKDLENNIWMH